MLQLNLYSDNTLNFMIEYYVTYLIEEIALQGVHFINEAKMGIVTAYELPELCRTNLTLSIDTYYEPVCDASCSDEIVYYKMEMTGTDICSDDEGRVFMKRMFVENFSNFYTCALDYRYITIIYVHTSLSKPLLE